MNRKIDINNMKFGTDGLMPMIVQDAKGNAVLSLFYANKEAIEKSISDGYVWRYSRSLGRTIKKGETSRNYQKVVSINLDCDSDAVLVKVVPEGPACHNGGYSCFGEQRQLLDELTRVISERKNKPRKDSYVSSIVSNEKAIVSKLREELEELIEARKDNEIIWEAADLLFFMLVYLENRDIKLSEVLKELERRRKDSR